MSSRRTQRTNAYYGLPALLNPEMRARYIIAMSGGRVWSYSARIRWVRELRNTAAETVAACDVWLDRHTER